ncbi:hypothetical protein S83_060534 [Arachis hypogaea]|nr:uncharacterized protein DS421_17g597010 [Arachis hypogaea]
MFISGEVANYTASKSHSLPFLDKDESWKLFCKKVFRGGECPFVLEPIGRSMVEKCRGLPLAIITLARVVAKKKQLTVEWMRIMSNVIWYLATDNSRVTEVLKLSYNSLPHRLKPCFLYFGMFPEDYAIPVKRLILLWTVEGLIQPPKTGILDAPEVEDIAEEYLNELVDRSLVMVAKRRSDGGVKSCRIHDPLLDLCISESRAENGIDICTVKDIRSLGNVKSCRLSLRDTDWDSFKQCDHSCIHSLMSFRENCIPRRQNLDQMGFDSARILDFGCNDYVISSMAQDLSMFIHLRYLRLNRGAHCPTEDHPDPICTLPNLETLIVEEHFHCYKLPHGIWRLKKLLELDQILSLG